MGGIECDLRVAGSGRCKVGTAEVCYHFLCAAHGRIGERAKPILELNPTHPLTLALAERFKQGADKPLIEDAAWLVLDEARLMEGASVENPAAFGARLRRMMEKALG